jgi:hypothetical protein
MADEGERKTVKLNRAGGSRAAVLPAAWLTRAGIHDEAVLTETSAGILVAAPAATMSIEDDPNFPAFLNFLLQEALLHPDQLGDVGELIEGDDELLEGVEPDAA